MKILKNEKAMISMGGVSLPLAQAIILIGQASASGSYWTMFRNDSAYQVPAGKKLVLVAIQSICNQSATGVETITIGYGDTVVAGVGAPTNNVELSAHNGGGGAILFSSANAGVNNGGEAIYFEVPAGKYAWVRNYTANNVTAKVMGYLVDV